MKHSSFVALLAFIAFAGIGFGLDFTHWTMADGLADTHNMGLAIDSTGNIWVGSWNHMTFGGNGVSMFDGTTWHRWYVTHQPGDLTSGAINDIIVDSTNTIWLSTAVLSTMYAYDNIHFFRDGYWEVFDSIYGFDVTGSRYPVFFQGEIWMYVTGWEYEEQGIFRYDGYEWSRAVVDGDTLFGHDHHYLTCDRLGNLWFHAPGLILICWNGDSSYTIPIGRGYNKIYFDNDNILWSTKSAIPPDTSTVVRYDGTEFEYFRAGEHGIDSLTGFGPIVFDSEENVWIFGENGFDVFTGDSFVFVEYPEGLPGLSMLARAVIDEFDQIWCTTWFGVIRFENILESLNEILDEIDEPEQTPENYLLNIYPNPFNSSCNIEKPIDSEADIFDIHGNLIDRLEKDEKTFHPSDDLPSGIYLVIIHGDKSSITKKISYIK